MYLAAAELTDNGDGLAIELPRLERDGPQRWLRFDFGFRDRRDVEEQFFAGHFPEDPVVPGVLIAESMAQFCGLALFAETEGASRPSARLARVDVKFLRAIAPPAVIEFEVQAIR